MASDDPTGEGFAVVRDGETVPERLHGSFAAIGNFDGVHRGHRALIEQAIRGDRPTAVVTFEPHPRAYFQPDRPMFRLTPEPVKLAIFRRLGLDGAFVLAFNQHLASRSAESFVRLLANDLKLSGVLIGYDFHFGKGREGNPQRMEELCRKHGLDCVVVPAVTEASEPISSSLIRSALEAGDVASANTMLGYRWFVQGNIRHGDKRGRELGYPTANMRLPDDCRLRHGIYAVRMNVDGTIHNGVASFGTRPTFDNGAPLLETFLFDFSGDLYGKSVDVEFIAWIRGEAKFDSIDRLIARMDLDSAEARGSIAADQTTSFIA
jgi:riboflavin kinase/FMN adenylyltransferase